jgi:hypothetical protein
LSPKKRDSILCFNHLSIIYVQITDYKYILWCFWWVQLVHFGNYIKNCVMPIKIFHELNFWYFGMECLLCVLIPKGIVDMTFISSFACINWNELQFKIGMQKYIMWHPFLFNLCVFPHIINHMMISFVMWEDLDLTMVKVMFSFIKKSQN